MKNKSKPSILMLGPSLSSRGGMATVEAQLVERLPRNGFQVSFISTYEDCGKARKALIALSAYAKYCRVLKTADVVHAHMASRGSYERKSVFLNKAVKEGKRTVVHLHGGEFGVWFDDELGDAKQREIRSLFSRVDVIIVLSEEWRDWLLSRGFSPKKLVVMHNAVAVPEKSCSPSEHQDILFLGRLDANKSPDVLLRASREALMGHPSLRLVFGGDGYPERYEALARELGIANQCEFLGWITGEEKEKLFKRTGVYCLPSKNEGMPMSVLEAMAHGIPTVATPVGGVPQVITDGLNGFLVPVDDESELSSVLCCLVNDPDLRGRIGSAGRSTVEQNFNISRNLLKLCSLYEELTSLDLAVKPQAFFDESEGR